MRVLVTGGSGFLGSHVVEALEAAGHEVRVFDLYPPPISYNGNFFRGDLLKITHLLAALKGMDAVCHLAAVGDVYLAFEKPHLAALRNAGGTSIVMEACLRSGVKRAVYASTWEVYGHPQYEPVDEAHPCNPDHPYNITKLAGEQIALSYDRLKGLEVTSLRLGTAYGERMRPNSVFSIFINRALSGQPLKVKGGGGQSRQFTHAREIGRAFALAVGSAVHGEFMNIVAPETISIRQLAELVSERLPAKIIIEEEARAGDVPSAVVSSDKAKRILGWESRISFRDGLFQLVDASLAKERQR